MTNAFKFLMEGLKNMKTIGSVARSSKYLCREMLHHVDFSKAGVVVELGAGDGVITHNILKKLRKNAVLIVFEINEKFLQLLETIADPRLILIQDSAEHLETHLRRLGIEKVDYIISAIPLVALPKALSFKIVQDCEKNLSEEGLFLQFHYSLMLEKLYRAVFRTVIVEWVPLNIPPAYVFICRK